MAAESVETVTVVTPFISLDEDSDVLRGMFTTGISISLIYFKASTRILHPVFYLTHHAPTATRQSSPNLWSSGTGIIDCDMLLDNALITRDA